MVGSIISNRSKSDKRGSPIVELSPLVITEYSDISNEDVHHIKMPMHKYRNALFIMSEFVDGRYMEVWANATTRYPCPLG